MRNLLVSLALLAIIGYLGIAIPQTPSVPRAASCDTSAIPAQIREVLKNKFAGWRPKRLSDLDSGDRNVWAEGQNGKACPGIAVGHFESAEQTSYALLLVPESEPTRSYKVLVLSKESSGESYVSTEMSGRGV